jgi:hypothetical protein
MRSAAPPPITITAAATPTTIAMIVPLLLLLLELGAGEALIFGVDEVLVEPLAFGVTEPEGASVGAPLGLMTVCAFQQCGHWAVVGGDPAALPPAPIVTSEEGVATLYIPSVSAVVG